MGRRLALLVATSRYVDPKLPNLRAPVQETQQLAQLLQDPAIGEFDSVSIVLDNRKSLVEYEIEKLFADRSPDDLVLLYVSGHGIKNAANELFFATNDTECDRPYSTAVPAYLVHCLLRECRARNKAVLLDCCYSGIASRLPIAKSDGRVEIVDSLGKGTYIMTATSALDRAYEDEKLVLNQPQPFSIFTDAVIKGLSGGVAARGGADIITAEDLYTYVYDELKRRDDADRIQLPNRYNSAEGSFKIANIKSRRLIVDEYAESPRLEELLESPAPAKPGELVVPIGQVHRADRPGDDVLRLNFTGQDGHIGVVGKIWSGKSVLVRTVVEGLRSGTAPGEVAFYCLDSGGQFSGLVGHPEVREVLGPFDRDRVGRLLERIDAEITRRHRLFRAAHLRDFGQFRRLRGLGKLPAGDNADLFLVVDGWDQFDEEVPGLRQALRKIASGGLDMGVHVVITARHWAEIPAEIERLLGARIELVLSDPAESKLDPELAATLPDRVGWGLYNGKRFLTALPGRPDTEDDLREIIATLESGAFTGDPAEAPEPLLANPSFLELLGIPGGPAEFDVQRAWRRRSVRDRFRVPFGVGDDGRPVELDLKEAAQEGMGPHGLCVGATGSGKSEFLRTLVLGLLSTHSSDVLNAVLIDFKGGATFRGLERAPHVSAVITNLADDVTLVDRANAALQGEMLRRQEVLRTGNFQSAWEYEKAREGGADLDPLPALFIVVDEFSELLAARPEFVDVFLAIGRVGRSLQMYLLLASQRLEEGRLRGLDSHLSYRIALRTLSGSESRATIGVPDAYELPRIPGAGYLKVGSDDPVRFKTAYVSETLPAGEAPTGGETELDVVVSRLAGQGPPAHEVWLPPLVDPYPLDAMLPGLGESPDRGLSAAGFFGNGRLQVPLGIVDRPFEQRRDPLWADFSGAAGHAVVVGGPQSGKSTVLRTLIMAMALTHTPEEAQFYCLDLGGSTLAGLAGLPHVGGVAVGRSEPEKARRIVAELTTLLAARETLFSQLGIDSITEFRNRKRRGEIRAEQDPFGDAFLIVDNWRAVRDEFEELETTITRIAAQGLSYGVHVVLSANRWADIRPSLKDMLGTRFELRLGDPTESDIDRRTAVNVPAGRPGRGLSRDKLHMITCLPRIDGSSDPETMRAGVADAVAKIKDAWSGAPAPEVRLLPRLIEYDDLLEADLARDTRLIPIGVDEERLQPVYLDFTAEPHFYAFADGESGKTNLLRQIARGISDRYTPKEAVIMLVDYRRTMLGFLQGESLLGYAVSAAQLDSMVKDVHGSMTRRLPGPDVTQEQLKARSWWQGPELFVLVDDYDLVATSTNNPLRPLAEFLAQAKDVGLHLVVVRRTGGASKAMFDPLLGTLKEIATPGLVMNGSRDEGMLVGDVRATAMPPGRGTLLSRKSGKQLIQVAWTDPDFVAGTPAAEVVESQAKG